jgi:hypothetical protein
MLNFDASWRFDSPGPMPPTAVTAFSDLIGKIKIPAGDSQTVFESFKHYFASAAGTTSSRSSSASWAESDMQSYIAEAATNAPLFIEAFYDACESLKNRGAGVPGVSIMNVILKKNDVGYEIRPPDLIATSSDISPVESVQEVVSMDRQAQEVIQNSLSKSEKFLAQNDGLAAVQELLWLMETISTAFQGLATETGTVQGKYFNKIVGDLRKQSGNTTLKEVLNWITTMHGYLSSPTGGGIRHGADIKNTTKLQPHEARLFCNLIRSYIRFLIDEHARLSGPKVLD